MRQALLALLWMPGLVGAATFFSPARSHSHGHEDPSQGVATLLSGRFQVAGRTTPEGTIAPVLRTSCVLPVQGLGAHVLYVEDSFTTRPGQPFSQKLLVLDPTGAGRVSVREFTVDNPSSLRGACAHPAAVRLSTEQVHERGGCAVEGHAWENGFDGVSTGRGCSSVLNGAEFVSRRIQATGHHVIVTDQGIASSGAPAWGSDSGLRFQRSAL